MCLFFACTVCTVVRIQALERLRLCQLRGENQGVESRLVDEDDSGSVDAERFVHRLVFFHVVANGFLWIPISQRLCHVFTYEERFALLVRHCPDPTSQCERNPYNRTNRTTIF